MADGFKERYEEHMTGRTGADAIVRICLVLALIFILLSFWAVGVSPFLYVLLLVLGIASAVYAVLRMNSRNVSQRKAEVDALMGIFNRSGSERPARDAGSRSERPRRSARTQRDQEDEGEEEERQAPATSEPAEEQAAKPEKVTVSCENCGQRLSVPAGKGTIRITCPKCKERFVAHT